jgi:hypothetical protein
VGRPTRRQNLRNNERCFSVKAKDYQRGLTATMLRSILRYDRKSGYFTWLKVLPNTTTVAVGSRAGGLHKSTGYWIIKIDGVRYSASRLAVLYVTGKWPKQQVDHKDLDRANNKWRNLRDATNQTNQLNTAARKNNKLHYKNIVRRRQRFHARITVKGVRVHLGYFGTIQEAAAAHARAAYKHHGQFART